MRITKKLTVLDAAEVAVEAEFWAAMLGGRAVLETEEGPFAGWHSVVVDEEAVLGVQPTPDHVPPTWKSEDPAAQRQQIHVDLYIAHEDAPAALDEALGLGAQLLEAAEDPSAPGSCHVLADPAGHPFCLCWE